MVQADNPRETIKASLLAKAEGFFTNFDSYETLLDEPEINLMVKRTYDNDIPVVVSKYRADGLTMEHIKQIQDNPVKVATTMNSRMEVSPVGQEHGYNIGHMRIKMPMFVSDRSLIVCSYPGQTEDGWTYRVSSSQGNEAQVEARQAEIGDDVVANQVIQCLMFKAYDGGVELKQCICLDLAGMLPDMAKSKMATKQSNGLKN